MRHRSYKPGCGTTAIIVLIAVTLSSVWLFRALFGVPDSKSDAEWHLERPLLAYDVWDGTPIVVFEIDKTGKIYIDQLILDPLSLRWPPVPRWQWTGEWRYINSTTDPASVAWAVGWWGEALYGQVNDPSIVSIQVNSDGVIASYPAAAPGFLIRLPNGSQKPVDYTFVDASGNVVWTSTGNEFGK